MGRTASIALLAALGFLTYAGPGRGATPSPSGQARRIVSLLPSQTEMIFEAGAGDLLVGVSRACDFPPEAARIEKIGDVRVDYEKLVLLHPDAVLSSETMMSRANRRLEELGLRVVALDPSNWEEIADALRLIGRTVGREDQGDAAAERLLGRVRKLEWRVAGVSRPRVAYLEASPQMILAAGPGSPPDLVIRTAGGANVFGDLRRDWDWVDGETLALLDPDVIVIPADSRDSLATRRHRARVLEVDAAVFVRPGPRLPEAAERLAQSLHPGRFE